MPLLKLFYSLPSFLSLPLPALGAFLAVTFLKSSLYCYLFQTSGLLSTQSPGQPQRLPLISEPTAQLKAQASTYMGNCIVKTYQQHKNVL